MKKLLLIIILQILICVIFINLCSAQIIKNFTITQTPALTGTITGTPVSCYGGNDGTATVTPSGGAPPYTYSWSPPPASGQTDSTATGLTAGTYYVTVTDTNGCTLTDSVTISEPPPIIITWVVDTATFGNNDGAINITVTDGVPPYSFLWSGLDTTEDISGIAAGTSAVVVTDANGCADSVSITVPEFPDPCLGLSLNFLPSTDASCLAICDGGGAVIASGGTGTGTI